MLDIFQIPEVQEMVFRDPTFRSRDIIRCMCCSKAWDAMCRPFLWESLSLFSSAYNKPSVDLVIRNAHLIRLFETNSLSDVKSLVEQLSLTRDITRMLSSARLTTTTPPPPTNVITETGCCRLKSLHFYINVGSKDDTIFDLEDVMKLIGFNPGLKMLNFGYSGASFSPLGKALIESKACLCKLVLGGVYLDDSSLEHLFSTSPTLQDVQLLDISYSDAVFETRQPWRTNNIKNLLLYLTSGITNSANIQDRVGTYYGLILRSCVKLTNLELLMKGNSTFEQWLLPLFCDSLTNVTTLQITTQYDHRQDMISDRKFGGVFLTPRSEGVTVTRALFTELILSTNIFGIEACKSLVQSQHRLSLVRLKVYNRGQLDGAQIQLIMVHCPALESFEFGGTGAPTEMQIMPNDEWVCLRLKRLEIPLTLKSENNRLRVADAGFVFRQLKRFDQLKGLRLEIHESSKSEQQQDFKSNGLSELLSVVECVRMLESCRKLSALRLVFRSFRRVSRKEFDEARQWCCKSWQNGPDVQMIF